METQLAMVEFVDSRPFSVVTGTLSIYDIAYCKRDDRFYAHQSGCGGGLVTYCPTYWAAPGVAVQTVGVIRPLLILPEPWTEERLIAIVESEDTRCEWCSICEDYLPGDNPCVHIFWCDMCGWWSSPSNECEHRRGISD